MDIQPASQQSSSDDQEIAKVLAGVNEQIEKDQAVGTPGLHFEESAPTANVPAMSAAEPVLPPPPPLPTPTAPTPGAALPQVPTEPPTPPTPAPAPTTPAPVAGDEDTDPALAGIKKDALSELRPLVDKLNVSAEEKFDTYLLLIRSTDDKSLIGPAHEAAKGISDDARRAQALLDVIKEIDYLSHNQAA